MATITSSLHDTTFQQHDIAAMEQALMRALADLGVPATAMLVKEELAKRIVAAAQNGIRDPNQLAAQATSGVPRMRTA